MKLMKHLRLVVILGLLTLSAQSYAQELLCKVILNLQTPTDDERRNWETFAADVESYLNSNNWSTNFSGDRIRCSMTFNITGSSGSNYTAQVYIQSSRPLDNSKEVTTLARFLDDKIEFSYVRGQSLQHGNIYRSLETFLDFYANLIIGLDFDSYGQLDGDPFFQNALNHALIGSASSGKGWERLFTSSGGFSRYGYAEDLVGGGAKGIRQLVSNYHFNVLDQKSAKEQQARANFAQFIDTLITIKRGSSELDRSVFWKTMLEAKYAEFAEFGRWFKGSLDLYYQKLSYLDPIHSTFYEQAKKKFED